MIAIPKAKSFPLGQIAVTHGALKAIRDTGKYAIHYFARHSQGDWGDVCPEDWSANDAALDDGSRLLSVYNLTSGVTIWVISENDRSATTILLPEEY